MAKLYYNLIIQNKLSINEVPEKWRAEVEALLAYTK